MIYFTVHIKHGTLVVYWYFSLVLWDKLYVQGVCCNWNMIKIKAWGHESTSADQKPMNEKCVQATDAGSGLTRWLSLCLVCSYCAASFFFSLPTELATCSPLKLLSPWTSKVSTLQKRLWSTSAIHFKESFVAVCYKHTQSLCFVLESQTFAFRRQRSGDALNIPLVKWWGIPSDISCSVRILKVAVDNSEEKKVSWALMKVDEKDIVPTLLIIWLAPKTTRHNSNYTKLPCLDIRRYALVFRMNLNIQKRLCCVGMFTVKLQVVAFWISGLSTLDMRGSFKAGVGRLFLVSLGRNPIVTSQHNVIQVV